MLKKLQIRCSSQSRNKRSKIFNTILKPEKSDTILDLGGGNGSYIKRTTEGINIGRIIVADISESHLAIANKAYGFETKLLSTGSKLPFSDGEFDIVFCNSVIEHVTIPKEDIWNCTNSKVFKQLAFERQVVFAEEIRRIGKSFFIQTPNKYFVIESHTWLPGLIALFPRKILIRTMRIFNKFWPKKAQPDWNLLTYKEMKKLFPDATIYRERYFGLTKSIIAIKKKENNTQ
jgi:hypothetical protein